MVTVRLSLFFFFNDTATTEIYTLSLHDALPISQRGHDQQRGRRESHQQPWRAPHRTGRHHRRSEEHTSELQSPCNLVCRLLLEKKKKDHKVTVCPSHMSPPMTLYDSSLELSVHS